MDKVRVSSDRYRGYQINLKISAIISSFSIHSVTKILPQFTFYTKK